MLNGFKSNSNKLEDIADKAFLTQTFFTKDHVVRYTKDDVYQASLAFETYLADKSHENLVQFQSAVAECVTNSRTGFIKLNNALLKILTEAQSASLDDKKLTLK